MIRRSACRLVMIVVSVCLLLVGASAASAASPTQKVAQGVDAATLPGASVFGNTPANTPETVSFIMREQNESQLAASVEQGVRSFESVSQFAARYGGVPSAIGQLRTYLSRFGITTTVAADQVDVVEIPNDNNTVIELRVAKDDVGKVIGKEGRTAQSMRTLLTAVSTKLGRRAHLDIVD